MQWRADATRGRIARRHIRTIYSPTFCIRTDYPSHNPRHPHCILAAGEINLHRARVKDLDRIDRQILELLQRDGRLTNQALSDKVALSPRACLDRVRRLEKTGHIAGYMALLEPRKLGSILTIVVEVSLRDQSQATHARFEQRMRQCDEVIECFLVSGECDYVLRLACRSLDHYRELTNAWTDDPTLSVERISSKPELQTVKAFRGYPI